MRKGLGLIATVALALMPIGGGPLRASPPPNGGTIAIEPKTADGNDDASMPAFVDAAADALTARGFTIFDDPAHAASVVELLLSRDEVGTGRAKDPKRKPISVFGGDAGIPLSTGASALVGLRRTRMELRIRRRGETGIVWQGTAVTVREAGIGKGTDKTVATDLFRALLQSYPAEPADVVGVP